MLQLRFLLLIPFLAVLFCSVPVISRQFFLSSDENEHPIIGILTQEVSEYTASQYPNDEFSSYIAASYVKFVEGAGARAVPIWTGKTPSYYRNIVRKINGVIFPSGDASMYKAGGYGDAGKYIYEAAVEMNREGTYFPILGICLGFNLLTYLGANQVKHRVSCSAYQLALPLVFENAYEESKMFQNAPSDVLTTLREYPSTANFHNFCITKRAFSNQKLNRKWKILSTNQDKGDIEFISAVEHKFYPFYGVQFNPEKNPYEFVERLDSDIPHSARDIRVSQYFANFFVDEARKNTNKFPNSREEKQSLIYNYHTEHTGPKGSSFVQQYLFTAEDESNN